MNAPTSDWAIARHRFRDDALAVLLVWAGFTVFVFAVVGGVAALRGDIVVSGWEVGSQLPRWFAGGIGVYLTAVYLPLYVAHGCTRREFARQVPVAAASTVAILAALMTIGYQLERAVYSLAGWSQTLQQPHLFDTPDAIGLVFLEFLLLFAVWTVLGSVAGAAFYRHPALGWLLLPLVLLLLAVTEVLLSPGYFGFLVDVLGMLGVDPAAASLAAIVGASVACTAVGLGLAWGLVRDLPLRSQSG